MAVTVECAGVPTGLSLSASIYPDASDTATATGLTATEATNRKTLYTFSTTATNGIFFIKLIDGSSNVWWVGWVFLPVTATGTVTASDERYIALMSGNDPTASLKSDTSTILLLVSNIQSTVDNTDSTVTGIASVVSTTLDDSISSRPTAAQIWQLSSGIETGVTPQQALQRIGATTAGKISGAGSGIETFLGLDGSSTRVVVTVDSNGNRTSISYS
jgi:hypothetical protein